MTADRKPFPNDPSKCSNCGGDGIDHDWRDVHGHWQFVECKPCEGTGLKKSGALIAVEGLCYAAMGFIGAAAILGNSAP